MSRNQNGGAEDFVERLDPNRILNKLPPSDLWEPLRDRPLNIEGDTGLDEGAT